MANLYIQEYSKIGFENNKRVLPFAQEPAITSQKLTFTTTTASNAFASETKFIRVLADADAHINFGAAPTSTVANMLIKSGIAEYFGVIPGQRVSAVTT